MDCTLYIEVNHTEGLVNLPKIEIRKIHRLTNLHNLEEEFNVSSGSIL